MDQALEEPVVAAAPVVAEPVRESAPVSSYYEAARRQAWDDPAPRIVEEHYEEPHVAEPVAEEPAAAVHVAEETPFHPEVVEQIPEAVEEPVLEPEPEPEPELVPVPASVFDDDFFRKPVPVPEPAVQTVAEEAHWPAAKVPSFSGYAGDPPAAETDELDIPAFLRRSR
jgi:cell division protein FtsZ